MYTVCHKILIFINSVINFLFVRIWYYGVNFSSHDICEIGIKFGPFRTRRSIFLGEGVRINRFCSIISSFSSNGQSKILIGERTHIAERSVLRNFGGTIKIGNDVLINYGSILLAGGGIEIGNDTKLGPYCILAASNHVFDDPHTPIRLQGNSLKGIKIGNDVWIGGHCTILDGCQIGDGCVVGAGSVVRGDIPPYSVVVGSPAKVIKKREISHV